MQPSDSDSRFARPSGEQVIAEKNSEATEPPDLPTGDTTQVNRLGGPELADRAKTAVSYVGMLLNKRFQLEALVGEGGMSIVYRARDILLNKTVAVKMLRPHLLHDPNSIRRLHKEALATDSLEHQNTAGVRHFDITDDGLPFIVMDFFQGQSLAELLSRQGAIEPRRATRMIRQIAEALEHAHAKGVIHRDLKSSNVIILNKPDQFDMVKVVDFGIAKVATADGAAGDNLTMTGEIFGSPIAMSPEQCRGNAVDARSDVYSLGCLAYEMLTGRPVFETKNTLELLFKQLNETPDSFKEANPAAKIPPELEAIVFKAMQKDLKDRYQSMTEMIADIDDLERKTLFESVAARVSLAATNKKRNNALRKAAVVAGSIMLLAGGGLYFGCKQLYGSSSLLAAVEPWTMPKLVAQRKARIPNFADKLSGEEKAMMDGAGSPSDPVPKTEPKVRNAIIGIAYKIDIAAATGRSSELAALCTRLGQLCVKYDDLIRAGKSEQLYASAAVRVVGQSGQFLYDYGYLEQAEWAYTHAQRMAQAFSGDRCGDEQFFSKLVGDTCFREVETGQRPESDYSRALVLYERVLPLRDDARLVSPDAFNTVDDQVMSNAKDPSVSALAWDAHRKRAECAYHQQQYAKALDDYEWVFSHPMLKSLSARDEALIRWHAGDAQRMKLADGSTEKQGLAERAIDNYASGLRWLPDTDPKNIALCNAYMAALADQYGIPLEQLPSGVSLESALKQMKAAFGDDNPATVLAEKQLADSLWRHHDYGKALAIGLDVMRKNMRPR